MNTETKQASDEMKKTMFWIAGLAAMILLAGIGLFANMSIETAARYTVLLVVFALLISMIRRRPAQGAAVRSKFGRMSAEPIHSDIRFDDVAANAEAIASLRGLVDYLKNPEKYLRLGARIPRGVLLYGPPGTGKTLLARALAGEAGVPFYSISGSDFVQMYVGVGASRVRDLFSKARKAGNCVIFIDEIDSMGKKRDDNSSDEREQTLNALLSEMSGFKKADGIIVLAATNRLDALDPALIRPGRFDRHIEVGLPGKAERYEILKLHCRNKPVSESVDLDDLAGITVRFSGASLESLVNEAAIHAAQRGADFIEQGDLDYAYVAAAAGSDRPGSSAREELTVIALHEAGHAIAALHLMKGHRLARISILPSSRGAAGYNLTIPKEHTLVNAKQLKRQIQVLLAGRAAEALINGEENITTGASNDLSRAAEIASAMVMDLGLVDEAAVSLRALQKGCQTNSQDGFMKCRKLLSQQYECVQKLLEDNVDDLMKLTETLLIKETMNTEDVRALLPHLF